MASRSPTEATGSVRMPSRESNVSGCGPWPDILTTSDPITTTAAAAEMILEKAEGER
jgi:hypothetical protein